MNVIEAKTRDEATVSIDLNRPFGDLATDRFIRPGGSTWKDAQTLVRGLFTCQLCEGDDVSESATTSLTDIRAHVLKQHTEAVAEWIVQEVEEAERQHTPPAIVEEGVARGSDDGVYVGEDAMTAPFGKTTFDQMFIEPHAAGGDQVTLSFTCINCRNFTAALDKVRAHLKTCVPFFEETVEELERAAREGITPGVPLQPALAHEAAIAGSTGAAAVALPASEEKTCHVEFGNDEQDVTRIERISPNCRHVVHNHVVVSEDDLPNLVATQPQEPAALYESPDPDFAPLSNPLDKHLVFNHGEGSYRCDRHSIGLVKFFDLTEARRHAARCYADGEPVTWQHLTPNMRPTGDGGLVNDPALLKRRAAEISINPTGEAPFTHTRCGKTFRDLDDALAHECASEVLPDDERLLYRGRIMADQQSRDAERDQIVKTLNEVGRLATHMREGLDDIFDQLAKAHEHINEMRRRDLDVNARFQQSVSEVRKAVNPF